MQRRATPGAATPRSNTPRPSPVKEAGVATSTATPAIATETYPLARQSLAFSGWRPKAGDVGQEKPKPSQHSDMLKEGLARSAWQVAEPLAAAWNQDGTCALVLAQARHELNPQIHCSSVAGEEAMRTVDPEILRGLATWLRASDLTAIEFAITAGRASFRTLY